MKVCLLTTEYHTEANKAGGVGRSFGKIAHWLADHGHDVVVVVSAVRDEEVMERPGITIRRVKARPQIHWRIRPLCYALPSCVRDYFWGYETVNTLADEVEKLAAGGRADVVLSGASQSLPLVRRGRVPVVVRLQHPWRVCERAEFRRPTLRSLLGSREERAAVCGAARVYAPSRCGAANFAGLRAEEIPVIRTPMFPLEEAAPWQQVAANYKLPERFVIFFGGLLGTKGAHVLADALPDFFAKQPDTHAVLVGRVTHAPDGGKMDDYIRRRSAAHAARLHILDAVNHAELFSMIVQARFVVLPSVVDNLPNSLLEAMWFGKAIVASRGASLDEILDDTVSILVPPGDVAALSAAMLRADTLDDVARVAMGSRAAEKVRRVCEPDAVMAQVVSLCNDAILAHGKFQ